MTNAELARKIVSHVFSNPHAAGDTTLEKHIVYDVTLMLDANEPPVVHDGLDTSASPGTYTFSVGPDANEVAPIDAPVSDPPPLSDDQGDPNANG